MAYEQVGVIWSHFGSHRYSTSLVVDLAVEVKKKSNLRCTLERVLINQVGWLSTLLLSKLSLQALMPLL